MVSSSTIIVQFYQSLNKLSIYIEDNDSDKSCVWISVFEPSAVDKSEILDEDMGDNIIGLNFFCTEKKVVGGFSISDLIQDQKLDSKIL